MDVGFNYPWPRNQVITIGPNVNERGKPHPWRAEPSDLDVNLARLRAAGITVVRIWLMGHGHNYDGVVTRTSRLVGHDWEFQPPPALHPLFAEDFTALLAKFAKAGLKMIPVLLDYSFFDEPEQLSRPAFGPEPTRTALNYMRGRRAVAEDPVHADRFIKGTLRPLLDVAARHRDTVYAFEIVNEPYWCVAPVTGSLFGRAVNRDRFRAFLSACVEAVNKAGLPSTIGHRYHRDSADYFSGIPVTRPQFHYYAHSLGRDALPNLAGAPAPRPFLGEFGAITPGEIITLGHHARNARDGERLAQIDRMELTSHLWPAARGSDAVPAAVLRERLDLLASMGYELAVIWPNVIHADPTRDELKLDEERLKQVRAFADRHRPARPR